MDRPLDLENLETRGMMWRRRAVTIPIVLLLAALAAGTFPLLSIAALVTDVIRRRRWATIRCVVFFTCYALAEVLFIGLTAGHWLVVAGWTRRGAVRLTRGAAVLANWWGWTLHAGARIFFAVRLEVEGLDAARGGPLIVLMRHASLADTVFSPVLLGLGAGLHLRYVVKHELVYDPVFDIIGHRVGTCFVRRRSSDPAREVEGVCGLLEGLGPRDGIVFYPEGTRFSPAKREQVLRRLAGRMPPAELAMANAFRNVLPPRLGGPLALLERNPGADVLICSHVGYEDAATSMDLWSGKAIGARVQVSYRRIPFEDIPKDREAIYRWLLEEWAVVDAWVSARRPLSVAPDAAMDLSFPITDHARQQIAAP